MSKSGNAGRGRERQRDDVSKQMCGFGEGILTTGLGRRMEVKALSVVNALVSYTATGSACTYGVFHAPDATPGCERGPCSMDASRCGVEGLLGQQDVPAALGRPHPDPQADLYKAARHVVQRATRQRGGEPIPVRSRGSHLPRRATHERMSVGLPPLGQAEVREEGFLGTAASRSRLGGSLFPAVVDPAVLKECAGSKRSVSSLPAASPSFSLSVSSRSRPPTAFSPSLWPTSPTAWLVSRLTSAHITAFINDPMKEVGIGIRGIGSLGGNSETEDGDVDGDGNRKGENSTVPDHFPVAIHIFVPIHYINPHHPFQAPSSLLRGVTHPSTTSPHPRPLHLSRLVYLLDAVEVPWDDEFHFRDRVKVSVDKWDDSNSTKAIEAEAANVGMGREWI
ncbi:hypothetical protein B0H12DRAFT_1069789 [Mycena haematopus]|nr:hypothetical protein B0H12DRAFT_1069789 [Mycena haematopus]